VDKPENPAPTATSRKSAAAIFSTDTHTHTHKQITQSVTTLSLSHCDPYSMSPAASRLCARSSGGAAAGASIWLCGDTKWRNWCLPFLVGHFWPISVLYRRDLDSVGEEQKQSNDTMVTWHDRSCVCVYLYRCMHGVGDRVGRLTPLCGLRVHYCTLCVCVCACAFDCRSLVGLVATATRSA
jgi:hypothetical protein